MNIFLSLSIFIASIWSVQSQSNLVENPDLALQLDENAINQIIKKEGPTIQKLIQSILPIKTDMKMNDSILNIHLYLNGGELVNVTLDFNKITFNIKQDQYLQLNFSLSNTSLKLYTEIEDSFPKYKRNMTIDVLIPEVDLSIDLHFIADPKYAIGMLINLTNFQINNFIPNITVENATSADIMQFIIKFVTKIVFPTIMKKVPAILSSLLYNISNNPIKLDTALLNTSFTNFTIALSFPMGFQTFKEKNIIIFPLNIDYIYNRDQELLSPNFLQEKMPFNATSTEFNINMMLGSSAANKVLWALFNSNFRFIIDNTKVPAASPVNLNTSSLSLILPFLYQEWPNKLAYLNAFGMSGDPNIYFRAGKTYLSMSLGLNFIVDTDGKTYPNIRKCGTSCVDAATLNMTLFVALTTWTNPALPLHLFAQVQNIIIPELYALKVYKNITIDTEQLKNALGGLIKTLIPSINAQLMTGIDISIISFLISQMEMINMNGYMKVAMNLQEAVKMEEASKIQ